MTFVLPEGLAPEVYPLAWLVGRWRGPGVVGYPGIEESTFLQEVEFDHDGGPYLRYRSTIRLDVAPDDAAALTGDGAGGAGAAGDGPGVPVTPDAPVWTTETGYWRVPPERPEGLPDDQHPVELLLADASGHVGLYVGSVGNGRVDLVSDVIARSATGAEITASTRLYGLVQGELMWANDLAAFGQPMQSYASARLARVTEPADGDAA